MALNHIYFRCEPNEQRQLDTGAMIIIIRFAGAHLSNKRNSKKISDSFGIRHRQIDFRRIRKLAHTQMQKAEFTENKWRAFHHFH